MTAIQHVLLKHLGLGMTALLYYSGMWTNPECHDHEKTASYYLLIPESSPISALVLQHTSFFAIRYWLCHISFNLVSWFMG